MKRIFTLLFAFVMVFGLTVSAYATLIDNGDGTITDDDFGIMWLADANFAATETFGVSGINTNGSMHWDTANSWIGAMNTAKWKGFSNWRLPTNLNQDGTGPDLGFNFTGSEMGHLYYTELGNIAWPEEGWGLAETGDFQNLQSGSWPYWTVPEAHVNGAYVFNFFNGATEGAKAKASPGFAMAVRAVPEPATMALLGIGLAGLGGRYWRRRKKIAD